MKPVILSEKPSQAKAYADAFNVKKHHKTHIELQACQTFPHGAIITWGIGHLVELKEPKEYRQEWGRWNLASLPILPDKYEFKVSQDKARQFNFIKRLFNDPTVTTIINACDCDREGSNIFYSIYYMTGVKNKTVKRLWINSLEVAEVRKGFNNLHNNEKDILLYYEARTRQISDWIVGMNASRLYTLLLQKQGFSESLSIGRVQTPTVYLIYQRQQEIANFLPKAFYEITGKFTADKGNYEGKAKIKSENRQEVEDLLKKHKITERNIAFVKKVTKRERRVKSPRLHALSSLQTVANRKWRYSPASVLKAAQQLYEKKLITYPRTDTQFITNSEFAYLVQNLEKYQNLVKKRFPVASTKANKRYVDNAKVQEHYAIIPTKTLPSAARLEALSAIEKNLYNEILLTTLAMFHSDYIFEERKIVTDLNGLDFHTTGKTDISQGWKELFPSNQKRKQSSLPRLEEGEVVEAEAKLTEGMTSPPKPYTEGQLIRLMKTAGQKLEDKDESEILKKIEGLGTEATRSGIIETIKRHGYIEVNKNIVSITKKGQILCQAVEGNLLSSPAMTAKWEAYLNQIGNGQGSPRHFINTIGSFIEKLIAQVPEQLKNDKLTNEIKSMGKMGAIAPCPNCKVGKIIPKRSFYGCSNYQEGCKQTFPGQLLGKRLTDNQIKDLCEKGKTRKISGFKSKSGKKFQAYLVLRAGKVKFEF